MEHCKLVHKVLLCLAHYDLYLHPEKCKFEKSKIEYRGLIIRAGEVAMDPIKVRAVTEWPTPKSLKELCGFVCFANFYQCFFQDFSKIARLLHNLTKKDVPFLWGPSQQQAFNTLKAKFILQPVLAMWNTELSTRIEVDASGYATGRVIFQKEDDSFWHPIAYHS